MIFWRCLLLIVWCVLLRGRMCGCFLMCVWVIVFLWLFLILSFRIFISWVDCVLLFLMVCWWFSLSLLIVWYMINLSWFFGLFMSGLWWCCILFWMKVKVELFSCGRMMCLLLIFMGVICYWLILCLMNLRLGFLWLWMWVSLSLLIFDWVVCCCRWDVNG